MNLKEAMKQVAVVLSDGETPSTDYFLVPYLEREGYAVSLFDGNSELIGSAFDAQRCRVVVISRYVPGCGLAASQRLQRQGAKLVYFMDDDLFDLASLGGLPWRYRWKIVKRAWWHRSRLMRLCDEFWVSTPYLAQKYARHRPVLLEPLPLEKTASVRRGIRVCYHGTASHTQEIEWLLPMIRAVQEHRDDIHFELFGGGDVARRFAGVPRVSVLHPMNWSNYLAYTAGHACDIALAPLMPSAFNAARGPTKFFDYTRMGAAGLYSDVAPYRGFVRDGVDGELLDSEPLRWVEAILMLANDGERRQALAKAARQRVRDVVHTVPQHSLQIYPFREESYARQSKI